MSLRDSLRRLAYEVRAIPGQLGVRVYTVSVVRRQWSGAHTGDDAVSETETAITEAHGQPPKVRWLNAEERAVQGIESGNIEIGPITTDTANSGTPLSSIRAWQLAGDEVYIRLIGPRYPDGALYRIHSITHSRAFHWTIQAAPVEREGSP